MTGSLLITGPPASGKSRAAMERFLAVPDSILLVPSATMAEHLRHELARAGTPIRPTRITTLAQFIEARSSSAAANAPLLHLLIREALSELQPVRFRAVADFAGFHQAIAALIDEAPASAVPEDLAAIFRSVERALETRGAALRSLRLIEAADHSSPLPQHVVFDGFFSFSPVEIVFLERLARRASLTVTLPAWPGAQAARRRLLDLNFGEMICSQRRR
ncbi:MAG: hypothetical protein LAO79_26570, partial [Acidobacteriia bacterium]|nr:hypothetical protein [Terriglobia bacterium]